LLRLTLSQSEKQEISLREELEFVQRYLQIQQTRFSDKLRFEQDIDPGTLECLVPTLILQPLVENAIRHGIEPSENAGLVRMTAHQQDGILVLTVEDDGIGLPLSNVDPPQPNEASLAPTSDSATGFSIPASGATGTATGGTGIGLANLRARLLTLYGSRQKLELLPRPGGGALVRVEIPKHIERLSADDGSGKHL
jgi:sensor histidine kinase YesM